MGSLPPANRQFARGKRCGRGPATRSGGDLAGACARGEAISAAQARVRLRERFATLNSVLVHGGERVGRKTDWR